MLEPQISEPTANDGVSANLLIDFYDLLPAVIRKRVPHPAPVRTPEEFSPGYVLPELDEAMARYFGVATATWQPVASYCGHQIRLMDLTTNPGTQTTKTYASHLIVARAVEFIRRVGEPIVIFTPTSANKGIALRDAVLRAIDEGLVSADELRIIALAPISCRDKLRASAMSEDPGLRSRNPMLLFTGESPEDVKRLGRSFVAKYAPQVRRSHGLNMWFSLDLPNYLVADAARAFFEHRADPTDPGGRRRVHVHAVSSAFGLLGYHAGREVLEEAGLASRATRPASLLVQHLATPDMVLNLRFGDFDRANLPQYRVERATGMYRRVGSDPHFPEFTDDPAEVLDPTFYTRRPVTSLEMNNIITTYGGDGVVVSLTECIARYPLLRSWLANTTSTLPADLRRLREWSTVMALTGVLNGIDRGLVESGTDVVVHGTGCYAADDFEPMDQSAEIPVWDESDIAEAVLG